MVKEHKVEQEHKEHREQQQVHKEHKVHKVVRVLSARVVIRCFIGSLLSKVRGACRLAFSVCGAGCHP